MSENIEVYYTLGSPASRPIMMLVRALGIKVNLKPIDLSKGEHMTPEFLNINPQHTLPTLVEDNFILWESRAIMKYLVDVYDKDKIFFPEDAKESAVVNQRLYFDATILFPRLSEYAMSVIMHNQQPDAGRRLKYEEALTYLDGFLAKSMWVAGQQMTIADFCVIANVATAEACGVDIENHQHLVAWYERAKEAMELYGYEEINQAGADIIGKLFKSKIKQ